MIKTQAEAVKKVVDTQLDAMSTGDPAKDADRPSCRMLTIDSDAERDDLWVVVIGVPTDAPFGITGRQT